MHPDSIKRFAGHLKSIDDVQAKINRAESSAGKKGKKANEELLYGDSTETLHYVL